MPDTNIGRWVFTAEALREQLFGPGSNWRQASTRNIEFDPKRNLLKSAKRRDPDYEGLAP